MWEIIGFLLDILGFSIAKTEKERRLFALWLLGDVIIAGVFLLVLILWLLSRH